MNNKEKKNTKKPVKKTKESQNKPKFDYKTHGKIETAYIFYE